jgi:hypothetical protein
MLAICAVLAVSFLVPDVASAGSRRAAPDPSPQKAPTSALPSPDPAPQAIVRSQTSHVVQPSTTSVPVVPRVTVHVTRPTRVTGVTRVTPPVAAAAKAIGRTGSSARVRARPVTHHRAVTRPPGPPTSANPVALSFPLAFIATDLLRVTAALRAGAAEHPEDGVLLLLSSLAMAVLAVSSFALLRRVKRLDASAR